MNSLPDWAAALVFFGAGIMGGWAAFARGLDLSENPPIKIRFFAELLRKTVLAAFTTVLLYAVTQTYGPQPPLVWVVAAIGGAFATEMLDLGWQIMRERILGLAKVPPPPPKP